jgi:hypothetical protein
MPLTGTLDTLPLHELLQCLEQNKRTGLLQFQHERSATTLWLEDGLITGFSSNDPPSLLGQFLLSRGRINEQTLQKALSRQSETGENLGSLLIEAGAIGETELNRYVVAKAEEAVYKMFEWTDARFEFKHDARPDPDLVKLSLHIRNVLVAGAQRSDEMNRMRRTLDNPHIVLCHTDRPLSKETANSDMAKRVYDLVDGKRSFGEILLLSRASEFLVTKFLYELCRKGVIRIKSIQESVPVSGTSDVCCKLAEEFVSRGEHEAALDILNYDLAKHPDDALLMKTLKVVESAYLAEAYGNLMPPDKIPVTSCERESIESVDGLRSEEFYLLSMIVNSEWSVESLVQLAPMYEVDVIRALASLLNKGYIQLEDSGFREEQADQQIDEALDQFMTEDNAQVDLPE